MTHFHDSGAGDEQLYRANILEHASAPSGKGTLENPDIEHQDLNPACGDEISVQLKFDGDKLAELAWEGHGCAISQASMSMLAEEAPGKSMNELKALGKQDIDDLLGVDVGATRIRCALLGLKTLQGAIEKHTDLKSRHDEVVSS